MKKDSKKHKTLKKSHRLPKFWSSQRKLLSETFLESDKYKENIAKGLPFFTIEELVELEKKYQNGITWNEIDTELSKKGMIFKKANFRKYVQEKLIPSTYKYRATKNGREALYHGDTIHHINFVQYFFRVADNELINELMDIFSRQTVSAKDAIEEQLLPGSNLREGVFTYLRNMEFPGDDIYGAISDVLNHDPELMKKAYSGLDEIYDTFHKKFNELVNMLENHKIPIIHKE